MEYPIKITSPVLILLVGLLSANVVNAELMPPSTLFTAMDINKDGYISPQEINKQSLLATKFKTVDKNHDGNLDSKEFEIFIAAVDI